MNVFYIDPDPYKAAELMVDRHVVKMILETAQLLSTAHRILDGQPWIDISKTGRKVKRWRLDDSFLMDIKLYQATHINHPSSIWARASKENYIWLFNHFCGLTQEYTYRYGKHHKCCDMTSFLEAIPQNIPDIPFTPPIPAMDAKYIVRENSLESYRNYYRIGKTHLHQWTKREAPTWIEIQ